MLKRLKIIFIIVAMILLLFIFVIYFVKPFLFPTVSNNPKISNIVRNFQDVTTANENFDRIILDGCDLDLKADKTIFKTPVVIKDETRTINQFVNVSNDLKIFCIKTGSTITYAKEAIKASLEIDASTAETKFGVKKDTFGNLSNIEAFKKYIFGSNGCKIEVVGVPIINSEAEFKYQDEKLVCANTDSRQEYYFIPKDEKKQIIIFNRSQYVDQKSKLLLINK
jgi:hypothetical protein